jgi:hypothetical protein
MPVVGRRLGNAQNPAPASIGGRMEAVPSFVAAICN